MKYFKLPALLVLCISFVGLSLSLNVYSQGLGDVKQLCDNATAANKAMARQAGYDLDQLCGEITTAGAAKVAVQAPAPVARGTVSSSEDISVSVAPVAVSGVGETAPASSLKPFGYDLFANAPTTYAPAASILFQETISWVLVTRWIFCFMARPIAPSLWISIERDLLISQS
jgi:hypothetical protein